MADQPISNLASQLLQREMAKNPDQFKSAVQRPVDRSDKGMSPSTLATIGGLADAASTYAFMKRGTHREANPLVNSLAGRSPEMAGLAALGGLAATKGITHLIGKKWPRAADAIAANLGAEQLGLAVNNTSKTFGKSHVLHDKADSGYRQWTSTLDRASRPNLIK